ncbi:MAG: hypothetical protein QF812_01800 [Nitrososphaerales archaeon]|jgi:carbohydrate-binding DOMON domain-containing protein|nr:hypothetical protein [Nitrososphaerales archaeon]
MTERTVTSTSTSSTTVTSVNQNTVTSTETITLTSTSVIISEVQEGNDPSSYSAIGIGIVIAGLLIAAAIYMRKSG